MGIMSSKTIRILCLGDSLVYGYSDQGLVEYPFSHSLAKMLQTAMPDTEIKIVVDGAPGDLVTRGTFLSRMQMRFPPEGSRPFDWTIVLGGTNDIGSSIAVDDIFEKLKETWEVPLNRGSKVLALTVPRATVDSSLPKLVQQRNAVNDRIKSYSADGFHVFDLHDFLPYDTFHAKYWDDAIHFTPDGYDFIGENIAVVLVDIIAADRMKSEEARGPS